MHSKTAGIFLALSLIIFGIFLILDSFYYFHFQEETFFLIISGLFSLFFYGQYLKNRQKLWGLVLGSVCLFFTYIFFATSFYGISDDTIGIAFFWILGGTLLTGFFHNRNNWGLIIPAGISITLGLVVLNETFYFYPFDIHTGFILFFGFALTFGILYLLNNEDRKLSWAAIPALIFLVIALMIGFFDRYSLVGEIIIPSIFILVGIYILSKGLMQTKKQDNNQLQNI